MAVRALLALLVLLASSTAARGQVYSRTDDTRTSPPERRPRPERLTLEVQAGGVWLQGNIDHLALNGTLALGLRLSPHNELFVDGAAVHAFFDGEAKIDKDKGSVLYVYKLREHWNLYAQSTHARNRFLALDYRTSLDAGVCLHSFGGPHLQPILVSLGFAPELEWWSDGTRDFTPRAALRLNLGVPLGSVASVGADAIYGPALDRASDYRLFGEAYVELKLRVDALALRVSVTEEFDSEPQPGIGRSDFGTSQTLVVHLKR